MYCDYVQLNLINVMIYSHLCIFRLQPDDKIVLFLFKSANRMLHCCRIFFSEYIILLDMKNKAVSLAYLLEILLAYTNEYCTKFVKIRSQKHILYELVHYPKYCILNIRPIMRIVLTSFLFLEVKFKKRS